MLNWLCVILVRLKLEYQSRISVNIVKWIDTIIFGGNCFWLTLWLFSSIAWPWSFPLAIGYKCILFFLMINVLLSHIESYSGIMWHAINILLSFCSLAFCYSSFCLELVCSFNENHFTWFKSMFHQICVTAVFFY